jgi:serine/threonine-protein kinase
VNGITFAPGESMVRVHERSSDPLVRIGTVIEKRYLVSRSLGGGSTGLVYEARSLPPAIASHGLPEVALKVLSACSTGDREAIARFTHEAYLGTRTHHPNLIRVVDFGRLSDRRPYFAMELHRGRALDRFARPGEPLAPLLAAALVEDAASALEALHALGVVHGDVKPANLLVVAPQGAQRPTARLLDLGIATVYDPARAEREGPMPPPSGCAYGTPGYVAPEQALGAALTPRADVYGLACVAYRLLTGAEPLRRGSWAETLRAHLQEEPPLAHVKNPRLPPAVDRVLAHGLEKDPRQRTRTPARLAAELWVALRAEPARLRRRAMRGPRRVLTSVGPRRVPTTAATAHG